jgi:hypothetical protein
MPGTCYETAVSFSRREMQRTLTPSTPSFVLIVQVESPLFDSAFIFEFTSRNFEAGASGLHPVRASRKLFGSALTIGFRLSDFMHRRHATFSMSAQSPTIKPTCLQCSILVGISTEKR